MDFPKNSLVWAKIKGHPWWPAQIINKRRFNMYKIRFCGPDKDCANVFGTSMHPFEGVDAFLQYARSKPNNKRFKDLFKTNSLAKKLDWQAALDEAVSCQEKQKLKSFFFNILNIKFTNEQ